MTTDTPILTVTDSSFEVVVFTDKAGGGATAVITTPDSPRKPTTHKIDPPPKGRQIVVIRDKFGTVQIVYRDVPHEPR